MSWYKNSILIFAFLIFPAVVSAEIHINEIYPAPKDGDFEWIELYNPEDSAISLDQYSLKDLTGKPISFTSNSIAPHSYAIATSSAVLNNKDETVYLSKKSGENIQTITYGIQFDSNTSYSLCDSIWTAGTPTKSSENNCPTPTPLPSPPVTPVVSTSIEPTQSLQASYSGIYINEVFPAPESGNKEWIELFNSNTSDITLTNWYVDSHQVTVSIPSNGYAVIEMSSSTFTNTGDTIQLLDSSKTVKDTFSYTYSEKGLSWGKDGTSQSFCLQLPSRGITNNICNSPTESSPKTGTTKPASGSSKSSSTKSQSVSVTTAKTPKLYAGIIQQFPPEVPSTHEEKEYKVSGYKTASEPVLIFIASYGFYFAAATSLLAIGMILAKMKRYLYEKDTLMALAVVTTICINGYYLHTFIPTRYPGF